MYDPSVCSSVSYYDTQDTLNVRGINGEVKCAGQVFGLWQQQK